MADNVKRRVAMARLAVAFAAAATIAGATAWAQADPSPAPTAKASAFDAFLKINSHDVIDGSLKLQDFHRGQVPSYKQFAKLKSSFAGYSKLTNASLATVKGEIGDIKLQMDAIKSELGGYVKLTDADARYIKLTTPVVMGDGSVFTASNLVDSQTPTALLSVPNLLTVNGDGIKFTIVNTSGGELGHTACGNTAAGTVAPGGSIDCVASDSTQSIQFFSWGERGVSATVSFSSVPKVGSPTMQDTVQILIGL